MNIKKSLFFFSFGVFTVNIASDVPFVVATVGMHVFAQNEQVLNVSMQKTEKDIKKPNGDKPVKLFSCKQVPNNRVRAFGRLQQPCK